MSKNAPVPPSRDATRSPLVGGSLLDAMDEALVAVWESPAALALVVVWGSPAVTGLVWGRRREGRCP